MKIKYQDRWHNPGMRPEIRPYEHNELSSI